MLILDLQSKVLKKSMIVVLIVVCLPITDVVGGPGIEHTICETEIKNCENQVVLNNVSAQTRYQIDNESQTEAILKTALEKGIYFLYQRQMSSGEFPTTMWQISKENDSSYVKSVFATTFVLHSLKSVKNFGYVENMSQQAIRFLLGEMEYYGLWRFYGKKSNIHFDIDDTCCALAALREWNIEMDYNTIASELLKYRNDRGIFNTWILDVDPPFEKRDNNVDWVVNANALFFYSLLDQRLAEVEQYLLRVVETDTFKRPSYYYYSPLCFIYCLTRAYADGHNLELGYAIPKIRSYLLNIIRGGKLLDNPLENALAIVGLLNCGEDVAVLEPVIEHLLSMQRNDGGWQKSLFFVNGPYTLLTSIYRYIGFTISLFRYSYTWRNTVFGSEELTTAIALEAISRYAEKMGLAT